ncbi:glycosyltransferase family 2 protein [Granulosicoccus sp.]|nr:glycosyltransferase family 2 protein [Granulosicoccus sp.]
MSPRFSVIIPTYNRADSVLDTLSSCFAQSCEDFEIVVVDDGSSDATLDTLKSVDDSRLVVIAQENAGPAAARNRGMRQARGQYIAFLDSDDQWYPDFLEAVEKVIKAEGEVLVYGQIVVDRGVGRYWVKPDRALQAEESIYDFLYVHGGFIQTSTMVVPRQLCDKVLWDESVTYGDNDQFAIDCWRTGIRFCMLPGAYTHYADAISDDALSQLPIYAGSSEKYTNFFSWMATQKTHMSVQAWAGYQARVESVALARKAPMQSFKLLWEARKVGAISLSGILRQIVQNLAPRLYRKLVDRYVRWRGLRLDQIRQPN